MSPDDLLLVDLLVWDSWDDGAGVEQSSGEEKPGSGWHPVHNKHDSVSRST